MKMRDIQDLLDELEDAAFNRQDMKISRARDNIDKWIEENQKQLKRFENLKSTVRKYFDF